MKLICGALGAEVTHLEEALEAGGITHTPSRTHPALFGFCTPTSSTDACFLCFPF